MVTSLSISIKDHQIVDGSGKEYKVAMRQSFYSRIINVLRIADNLSEVREEEQVDLIYSIA